MTGYICKQCGGVAPVGIGYVSSAPGAVRYSATVTVCPCGHSTTDRCPVYLMPGMRCDGERHHEGNCYKEEV